MDASRKDSETKEYLSCSTRSGRFDAFKAANADDTREGLTAEAAAAARRFMREALPGAPPDAPAQHAPPPRAARTAPVLPGFGAGGRDPLLDWTLQSTCPEPFTPLPQSGARCGRLRAAALDS